SSVTAPRRAALHAAIGAAIEEEFHAAIDEHAVELAYHYSQSARPLAEKALHFATLAAERAVSALAHDQAAESYRLALDVFDAAIAAVGIEDTATRARLLANLAVELTFSHRDMERRRALSDEALSIARRAGDRETLAHVLSGRHETIWHASTLEERLANSGEH